MHVKHFSCYCSLFQLMSLPSSYNSYNILEIRTKCEIHMALPGHLLTSRIKFDSNPIFYSKCFCFHIFISACLIFYWHYSDFLYNVCRSVLSLKHPFYSHRSLHFRHEAMFGIMSSRPGQPKLYFLATSLVLLLAASVLRMICVILTSQCANR